MKKVALIVSDDFPGLT
ncbi:MAG: hypothetical protein ACPLPQ_10370, partial [Candidatus Saccharicenans sp.]